MSLIEQSYPAPVGGVSQMPPHLRGPAQVTEAINTFPSLLEGLGVRRGTTLLGSAPIARDPGSAHTIDWSPTTDARYWVTIGSFGIVVTDINTGLPYIPFGGQHWQEEQGDEEDTYAAYEGAFFGTVTDPSSFTSTVIGDTVYIGVKNYSRIRWNAVQAPPKPAEAIVTIKSTGPDTFHTFTVGSSQFTNLGKFWANTTPAWVAGSFSLDMNEDPAFAAEYEAIVAIEDLATSPGTITIRRKDATNQAPIPVSTGNPLSVLEVTPNTVPSFDRLPENAPDGFVIRIVGQPGTLADDAWVIRQEGRWVEAVAPGANIEIDPWLMPWALKEVPLVNSPTKAFLFGPVKWTQRNAGDDFKNPLPDLQGIDTLFSAQQRLGFTSGTRIVLSESNNARNLFRTTVTQLLPSDPINIQSGVGPNAPYHAFVSWDNSTYLWSNQAQIELNGEPVLTPTSVSLSVESRFENDAGVGPVVIGSRIYFTREVNGCTRVYEYWRPPGFNMPPRVDDVTEMVPRYLQGSPVRMVADDTLGFLAVMTSVSDNLLYCCHFTRDGNGQIQPRWHTWKFAECRIYAMRIMQGQLYLLLQRQDTSTMHIEVLDVSNPHDFDGDVPYDIETIPVVPSVTLDGFFIRDRQGAVTQKRWVIRNLTIDYLKTYQAHVENVDEREALVRLSRTPLPTTGKMRIPLHRRHDKLTLQMAWLGFITSLHYQGSLMDRNTRATP